MLGLAGGFLSGVVASFFRLPLAFQMGDLALTPPIALGALGAIVGFAAGTFKRRKTP
jgi:hypothetical protein